MKNSIAIFSLAALAAASIPNASAGDREWATVGKILTGVAAAHVIAHAVQPAPVYVSTPAVVAYAPPPPPVVVAPAPVVYYAPAPVVAYAPPVCVPAPVVMAPRFCPPPFVSVNVGFGHHHRRHCR